ncbi:MAG TPA: VWA domain-containing protein [Bryobacteraceae bacterium]|jgi:Ca-activated chloride channel family protein|nr:VWA domain-containing protein [Bryobacteraceae bacterium]
MRAISFRVPLLALAALALLTAQKIVVDTTLVVIPVTVTDPINRFVLSLEKEDFTILEEGAEQKITHFSGEDAPLSVGILVDTSGSMDFKLDTSRRAVAEFLKTMNAQDEAFLIQFNDQAQVAQAFTSDMREIENRMTSLRAGGLTALLDAVDLGVREMKKAKNPRKALVVVSDGGDNHSRYTASDIKDVVREADTQIYAMGVFEPNLLPQMTTVEVSGPRLLAQIADQTGGRAFGASEFSQLPAIAEKIAIELRNQYVLAYSPTNGERDGKYRHVEVRVRQPKGLPTLKARWRLGYYAPMQP